ncbi:MAG: cytochrome c biogenesis protein ResB, partial [Candidatus Limnocylindrales bacterium]
MIGTMIRQIPSYALRNNPLGYAAELADLHRRYDPISILGANIGPGLVGVFDALGFFRIFTAPWFTLLLTLLVVSIVVCTLDRLPRLWRTAREVRPIQPAEFFDLELPQRAVFGAVEVGDDELATVLGRRRYGVLRPAPASAGPRDQPGDQPAERFLYGDRNRYFKLATLLTHLGLILFIGGGAVTGAFGFETVLFVAAGQTAPVEPVGTPDNLLVKSLGFEAPQRPDGSFADFRTDLAVYRDGQQIARKTIRVNDPLEVDGFVFHQNTFGAAETLDVRDPAGRLVWHGPVLLDDQVLGKPEGLLSLPGSPFGMFLILDRDAAGTGRLTLLGTDGSTDSAGNLVPIFADQLALGATSDPTRTLGYTVRWIEAGAFSGIVTRRDPGQPLIWVAYLALISGIVMSFYFPRRRIWLRRSGDRLEVAMLADRYVDVRREFAQLLADLARVTG